MEERTITKAEFDAAKEKVMNTMLNDPELDGMPKVLIPLTGLSFAVKMKTILFSENDEKEGAE